MRDKSARIVELFLALLAAIFAVLSILLAAFLCLPFEAVRAELDRHTVDGCADIFTESLHLTIVNWFGSIGLASLFVSAFLYIHRRALGRYICNTTASSARFFKELIERFRKGLQGEEGIHIRVFIAVLSLGIAVRLIYLNQPMRYDEAYTFTNFASLPPYLFLSGYDSPNNHIFHTLLVHLSYIVFGNKPWALRMPAFLAGALLMPATYLAGRIFYNKYSGLLALVFVAASPPLISYSADARGYTLICLFFLVTLLLASYLKNNENSFAWSLFAALSTLGFYTIPIMLYPFTAVAAWLFLSIIRENRDAELKARLIRYLAISSGAVFLMSFTLYVPVFMVSGFKSMVNFKAAEALPVSYLAKHLFPFFASTLGQWTRDIPLLINLMLLSGFVISMVLHRRLASHRISAAVAAAASIIPLLFAQRIIPYERVWMFLLPLYFICASSGIVFTFGLAKKLRIARYGRLMASVFIIGLAALLCLNVVNTGSVYSPGYYPSPLNDAKAIALFLRDNLKPNDGILLTGEYELTPMEYYFNAFRLPIGNLKDPLDGRDRIFVVVKHSNSNKLVSILKEKRFSHPRFTTPRLIAVFNSSALFEIKPAA